MQCQAFEDRLNLVLDQRGDPAADSRLTAHAARCDDCRQLLAGQATLFASLDRMPNAVLRHEDALRIVQAANQPTLAPSRSERRGWLAIGIGLATAATALLAVSAIWLSRSRDENQVAVTRPAPLWWKRSRERTGELAMLQPGTRRGATGREAAVGTIGADLLIEAPRLPSHLRRYRGAIDDFVVALPDAALRFEEMEQLAPGIRPLRISLAMIWDTLCRTIPGSRGEPSPQQREGTSRWWVESLKVT